MSDAAYQNALARRAALTREIERVDAFLGMYREFSAIVSDKAAISEADERVAPEERAARGTGAKMLDLAEDAITAQSRPLTRVELLKAIEDRGLKVGGKDPGATLASALWRDKDRFVNIKTHGYWLKAKPYEAASYYPEDEELYGVTDSSKLDVEP
jgi:hypothetical protein